MERFWWWAGCGDGGSGDGGCGDGGCGDGVMVIVVVVMEWLW